MNRKEKNYIENKALTEDPLSLEASSRSDIHTLENIKYYYQNKHAIGPRLLQLEEEWDIERMLEFSTASLAITGVTLGVLRNRGWLLMALGAGALLAGHAIQGWCPAVPILRRLGYRTKAEIDKEKYALKALRGDFKYLLDVPNVVWNAVNE